MEETTRSLLISETKLQRKKLKAWLLIYFILLITGIILSFSQKNSMDVVPYLWIGIVILNVVCLALSYSIKMSLYSLNLSEGIGPVLFIISILSIPGGLSFILALWVLIDSRIIDRPDR